MQINIVIKTILAKKELIVVSTIIGAGLYYPFEVIWVSVLASTLVFLFIYILFLGPRNLVSREAIEKLVSDGIISPLDKHKTVKQYLNDGRFIQSKGFARFDRFDEAVTIFISEQEIVLDIFDMPYLPFFQIEINRLQCSIEKEIHSIMVAPKESFVCIKSVLTNGKTIFLYIPKEVYSLIGHRLIRSKSHEPKTQVS